MCHISQFWQLWHKSNFLCHWRLWAGAKNLNFVFELLIWSLALSDISKMNALNALSMLTFIIFTTDSTYFILVYTVKLGRMWKGWTTRIRVNYTTGSQIIWIWDLRAKLRIIYVERVSFKWNVLYFKLSTCECPVLNSYITLKYINIITVLMFFSVYMLQLLWLIFIVNLSKFFSNVKAIECLILFAVTKKWSYYFCWLKKFVFSNGNLDLVLFMIRKLKTNLNQEETLLQEVFLRVYMIT